MMEHFAPSYDAAWELCRIGVLRPGPFASMGVATMAGGGTYSTDGYSITELGRAWLADAAHDMATTIEEVEAYASLTQVLRLAQFCSDRWADLTALKPIKRPWMRWWSSRG
jgi:hypothetical protein